MKKLMKNSDTGYRITDSGEGYLTDENYKERQAIIEALESE